MSLTQPIQPPKPTPTPTPISEDEYRRYMLGHAARTASATRFIAWIVGIGVLISLISGLVLGAQIASNLNQINQGNLYELCNGSDSSAPQCANYTAP